MTLTRILMSGRLRPATLLKLTLRRIALVAALLIGLAVLHELSAAQPVSPVAMTTHRAG